MIGFQLTFLFDAGHSAGAGAGPGQHEDQAHEAPLQDAAGVLRRERHAISCWLTCLMHVAERRGNLACLMAHPCQSRSALPSAALAGVAPPSMWLINQEQHSSCVPLMKAPLSAGHAPVLPERGAVQRPSLGLWAPQRQGGEGLRGPLGRLRLGRYAIMIGLARVSIVEQNALLGRLDCGQLTVRGQQRDGMFFAFGFHRSAEACLWLDGKEQKP